MLRQILQPSYEAYFLWLELALSFVIPDNAAQLQEDQALAQLACIWPRCISLFGFITNRLNVSLIGFETYVGHHYVPKWTEFSVTLMIIAMGFALFRVAVKYLPIFPQGRPRRTEHQNRADPPCR